MAKDKAFYNFKDTKSGVTFPGVQFQLIINRVAKDITGAVITMVVGGTKFSTDNGGILITDALTGKFQFKKQVINLTKGVYPYEIIIVFANGDIKTYLEGNWRII
jgi:hypothetical protein